LIELLEYVRRKAPLLGGVNPWWNFEFKDGVLEETCLDDAAILPPLEELEEMVSSESWP